MKQNLHICKKYMQRLVSVYLLVTPAFAMHAEDRAAREPANFVPDDDLIVVPMVVEKSFVDKFNDRHEGKFKGARKKLEFWIAQEAYAEAYGLENTGFVRLPSESEKQRFLQRNYLRFISKDIEKTTKKRPMRFFLFHHFYSLEVMRI